MKPSSESAEARLRKRLEPVVAADGFEGDAAAPAAALECVKIELKGAGADRVLRVYIDKPGGITLDDCERVSRRISAALDADEASPGGAALLAGGYVIEVSSPGLDRPLVKPADFERFRGCRVRVETRLPLGERKRWVGELQESDAAGIRLAAEGAEAIRIGWDNIGQARLAPQWPAGGGAQPRPRAGKAGRRR